MLHADLYEKTIPLESYVSSSDCCSCGFQSRAEFLNRLRAGKLHPGRCGFAHSKFLSLLYAARPEEILPRVEILQHPAPVPAGLIPVNAPDHRSPVLISGNSKLTVEVLSAVLSTTLSPFWYWILNTDGHTVDMALVYGTFSVERVLQGLHQEETLQRSLHAPLVLPGLAASLQEELTESLKHPVTLGPVCAAELPLFFGEQVWRISC